MRLREAEAAFGMNPVLGAPMVQELPKGTESWLEGHNYRGEKLRG